MNMKNGEHSSNDSNKENTPKTRPASEIFQKRESPWQRRSGFSKSVKEKRKITFSGDTSEDSLDSWNNWSSIDFQDINSSTPNLVIDKKTGLHDLMTGTARRRRKISTSSNGPFLRKKRGASSSSLTELLHNLFHRSSSTNLSTEEPSYNMEDITVQHWRFVEKAVDDAFHEVELEESTLYRMHEHIKELQKTMIIYDHIRDDLLPRGMTVLQEEIGSPDSSPYSWDRWLYRVADVWRRFYQDIVPLIESFFCTVHPPHITIRQLCLAAFRNHVVLKLPIEQAIQSTEQKIPKDIRHMLLIMQGIRESDPPNFQSLEMEKIIIKVVRPYLGYRGIYIKGENSDEPTIPSQELQLAEQSLEATTPRLSRLFFGPVGRKPMTSIDSFTDLVKKATRKNGDS